MFGGVLLNNLVAWLYVNFTICEAYYSACKNYILCMLECVGNYSIPTAHANVECADTLAGEGILIFLNIYVQQIPVNSPRYSVDNSRFWCRISSVVHKRFLSKLSICRPNLYWPMLLVSYTERDELQNCLDNTLAELENWLKAQKTYKT